MKPDFFNFYFKAVAKWSNFVYQRFVSDTTPATGMIFGSGQVTVVKGEDHKCKDFTFKNPFASGEVNVQLTLASENYTASVTWAESVTTTGYC